MPEYNFNCSSCNAATSKSWSVSEYDQQLKKVKCDNCGGKLERCYDLDNVFTSVKDIKTIGQLADSNASKYKSRLNEAAAKKSEETKVEKPWYDKYTTATSKEINNMTDKQKVRYIMEGRK